MNYDKKIILAILQLVKENGNVQELVSDNFNFTTVYKYLSHLKRNGLISDTYGELVVTDLGTKEIKKLNDELDKHSSEKWIIPQYEYIIEKWDKFRIYLP